MTESVERPPDEEPPGEDRPHGLVEEIKEEIEHAVETAVEHVPKPVRWTVRKLVLLAFAALISLIVIAIVSVGLYYANRTQLVAQELTVFLNGTLATRSDVVIEIHDIKGNPLKEVRLIEPRVRFRDGDAASLLEAPSIRLRYSALGLVRSNRRSIEIDVDSPVIRLSRGPDGKLRLPAWKSSGSATAANRRFDVRLRLHHARFLAPAPLGATEGLELDASVAADRLTRVRINDLRWSRGMYQTRRVRMTGEISKGDSVLFTIQRFRSADLDLRANGAWKSGTHQRQIHAEIDRVRWRWIADVRKDKFFDVPGEGSLTVDAQSDHGWRGDFTTTMTWDEVPVSGRGSFTWADQHLVVNPLVAHSSAGDLDGSAEWTRRAWQIGGAVKGGDPSHWNIIGLDDWPAGRLEGRFVYRVDTHRPDHVAELEATVATSELADWNFDRGEVAVHFPAVGPDSFTVHAFRRGGEAWLRGASAPGGWNGAYQLAQFPLDEWPQGRATKIRGTLARGEGTVAGHHGVLTVTGTLDGVATDWLGMHAGRFHLEGVEGQLLPTSDLTMDARLNDMMWLGIHFDSTLAGLHLVDQTLALDEVRAHAGDTLVTAAGRSQWNDAGWSVSLDRARAKSRQFDWTANPPVRIAGDKTSVLFDRLEATDGPARLSIDGRWAVPGGSYDWRAKVRSLDLARAGMPESFGLAGTSDLDLVVQGSWEQPRWSLDAHASRPAWQGHRADSLAVALTGEHHRLQVRDGQLRLEGGTVRARGVFEQTVNPEPDSLTATAVSRWLSSAQRWSGNAGIEGLPLERMSPLVPAAKGWAGNLSATLAVEGSPASPRFEATVSAAPLSWQGYRADDLHARASYRDERLSVGELRMTRGHLVSTASGEMPLRLAMGKVPEMPERPMSWKLEVPNGDLAVIPLFVPQIAVASGKLEVHAVVKGTPRHPDLDGELKVRDGRVRLAGREEVLEGVTADCRLDESHVTLDTLTARQGKNGTVRGHGAVEISGTGLKGYHFDLTMREFSAVESGVYAAEFDGDFAVVDGPRVGKQIIPKVTGSLTLRRAVILFDFASQSAVQQMAATAQPIYWTYDINLIATNGLRWQPPDGEIEFSANLRLDQTLDELIIFGDMNALRGSYYFLSNRFNVKKADLTFDNVEGVNPVLDIEAETKLTASPENFFSGAVSQGTQQNKSYTITVTITGRAKEPVIEMASDPSDLDEARILQQLTVGRFVSGKGGVDVRDPLDNYVTRAINKTLSSEMSRTFRGYINEWTIDREGGGLWTGSGDVYLGVGSQVTPNLLLRYKQRVPGFAREGSTLTTNPFERDIEAEYRLNRFFYVSSQLTQRRTITGGTNPASGPEFNVNLKARWEY
jgi:hypothetical protein